MTDTDTRVDHLLNSVLGAAVVVMSEYYGLAPAELADPRIALRLAASAADEVEIWNADYDSIASRMLELASEKRAWARDLLEHPGAAWWFEDLDHSRRGGRSVSGAPDNYIYGMPPNPSAWERPRNPSGDWELYAQKPYSKS